MYSTRVNGYIVEGNDVAVKYLDQLEFDEVKVLLREARTYGQAKFEHNYIDYTLVWDKNKAKYTAEKR
ncbi:MAG: hypothetical protein Q8Q20_03980 [bacterium]|nr:hypothetical protein [bacterium]